MAKNRMINTKIWDDGFIRSLEPLERYLFLYFLTSPLTELCGIYEITLDRIAFDTGLTTDKVKQTIDRLSQTGKIVYENGWLAIKNFTKYQKTNPSIDKGIENSLSRIPDEILASIKQKQTDCIQTATVCEILKPKLNSKLNSKSPKEFSDEVKKLSDFLYECIKRRNEGFCGNPRKWDDEFDKLLRIDKRPYEQAAKLLQLSQEDSFWQSNILSGEKFRKQYDQLYLKLSNKTSNIAFIS